MVSKEVVGLTPSCA